MTVVAMLIKAPYNRRFDSFARA